MALSKTALRRVINSVPEPDGDDVGKWVVGVCRAIEAEVRKQDTALIRQMDAALDASEAFLLSAGFESSDAFQEVSAALTAGRARLEGKA